MEQKKKLSLAITIKFRFPNGKLTTDIFKTAREQISYSTYDCSVHIYYIFTLNCFTKAFKHACSYMNQTYNLVRGTGEALYFFHSNK